MQKPEIVKVNPFGMNSIYWFYDFITPYFKNPSETKFYNPETGSFFGDKFHFLPYPDFAFIGFQKRDDPPILAKHNFKLHYAVDHQDLEKAFEIIGTICNKYDVFGFKIITAPLGLEHKENGYELNAHEQDGKDFTIYIGKGQDNPEFMAKFVQEIETALKNNNIRPSKNIGQNLLDGDKPINGSDYGFYRYQNIGDRDEFMAPPEGDFMEQVSTKQDASNQDEDMYDYFLEIIKGFNFYDFIINNYYQKGQKVFFDQYERKLVGNAFTGFYTPKFDENDSKCRPQSKFKLHYAVDHQDLEKALKIIGEICNQNNIPGFKVVCFPFGQATLNQFEMQSDKIPPHQQDGKDFTIYIGEGQDNPEFMRYFTQLIEHNFIKNGIRPAPRLGENILLGDKPINGSIYGSYRYEVNENGIENPRRNFVAPIKGDFMENVTVSPQSPKTMMHTINIPTQKEMEETKNVLSKIGINFSIQENAEFAVERNPQIPSFKLIHQEPYAIRSLLNQINQETFENTFSEEFENKQKATHVQKLLKKIGIQSYRIQPFMDKTNPKRIVLCQNNDIIQQLMQKAEVRNISQMDIASVSSREEAIRLCTLLKKHGIPAGRVAYQNDDGVYMYSIVYKMNPDTDKLLRKFNAGFIDEKNPLYTLKDYAQNQQRKIG